MCFHHLSPSGVAYLLFARGLLMPISEVRRRLARCLLQASKVLLHCNVSVHTPLPNRPKKPMGLQGAGTYTRDRAVKKSARPPCHD